MISMPILIKEIVDLDESINLAFFNSLKNL